MKPYRVNADYEIELFHQKLAPVAINHAIEFFIFFLSERPLYSNKKYSSDYLKHVQEVSGREAKVVSKGPYENFWGPLDNLEVERWWNSKITSAQLIIDQGWCKFTSIIDKKTDLSSLSFDKTYILKDATGMSGQKFLLLRKEDSKELKLSMMEQALKGGAYILEPYFDRKYDFSQYVFPGGEIIAYQNLVDQKFQYKGSIFSNLQANRIEDLPFYHLVSSENWLEYKRQTEEIIEFYSHYPNKVGYSIDSFVYLEDSELKIRAMSEVNCRRTMGRVAFELSNIFSPDLKWSAMILVKSIQTMKPLWEILRPLKNVIVLSPGDSRFEIFHLAAKDEASGLKLISEMNDLLAETELSIKI